MNNGKADNPNASTARTPGEPDYEDLPKEQISRKVEQVSPEGIPAEPEASPRRIAGILIGVAVLVVIVGIVLAILIRPVVGLLIMAFGLLLLIFNPEVWANLLRAKDREKARQAVARERAEAASDSS